MTDHQFPAAWNVPAFPTVHPTTGKPFVENEIGIHQTDERVEWGPPIPPSRECVDYDEDGIEFDAVLTDEEFDKAMESYERAKEEWRKTGGVAWVKGPTTITARFECADGSWAEYMTAPGAPEWRWVRSEGPT